MKTTSYYFFTVTLIAMAFALSACNTEGPTGPQGEPGPQGLQGPPGEDGEDGTANVIYSEWMDIVWNVEDEVILKVMRIDEPNITEEFLRNSIVLMYIKLEEPGTVVTVQLPFLQGNDFLYFRTGVQTSPEFAGLIFYLISVDNSTPVSEGFGDLQIRYFLIPGGVPAKMPANFFEDYDGVKEYYGITD